MTVLIHRYWEGPPRDWHTWVSERVRMTHPTAVVCEWSDSVLPSHPRLSQMMGLLDDPRHRSNVVRYAALHKYGGLYLHSDVIPLTDLTKAGHAWTAATPQHREPGVMWFPDKGHPLLAALMMAVRPGKHSWDSSGAAILNEVAKDYQGVGRERRVLPFDAKGRYFLRENEVPMAVHLWATTSNGGLG